MSEIGLEEGDLVVAVRLGFGLRIPAGLQVLLPIPGAALDFASGYHDQELPVAMRFFRVKDALPASGLPSIFKLMFGRLSAEDSLHLSTEVGIDRDVTWVRISVSGASVAGSSPPHLGVLKDSLKALNYVLRAYMIATREPQVHEVSSRHLSNQYIVGRWVNGGWEFDSQGLINLEFALLGPDLSKGETLSVLDWIRYEQDGHPFLPSEHLLQAAGHAHTQREEYTTSIVVLHASVETRLFALYRCLLLESGMDLDRIEAKVSEVDGFSQVAAALSQLLGGNWSRTGSGLFARYFVGTYALRNRVVHAGYTPSHAEVNDAFEAHSDMLTFVRSRLIDRRFTYPRSLMAMVGEALAEYPEVHSQRFTQLRIAVLEGGYPFWSAPELRRRTATGTSDVWWKWIGDEP